MGLVLDDVQPLFAKQRQAVEHPLQHLGGMTLPALHLADHAQRLARAVGLRDVARELLVRDVGVVLEGTGRLDDIDVPACLTPRQRSGQLRSPDGSLHERREVDVVGDAARLEVGAAAGDELLADPEARLRPVVEGPTDELAVVESHRDVGAAVIHAHPHQGSRGLYDCPMSHVVPAAGDEVSTLLTVLERNRRTFAWKCSGLDAAGLRARAGASPLTLAGMLKHLALIEDYYFTHQLQGVALPEPWDAVDFDSDPSWEWRTALDDDPEYLRELWRASVLRSRAAIDDALADCGLDRETSVTWPDGNSPSLRRFVIDVIEEYARHTGHADVLRE